MSKRQNPAGGAKKPAPTDASPKPAAAQTQADAPTEGEIPTVTGPATTDISTPPQRPVPGPSPAQTQGAAPEPQEHAAPQPSQLDLDRLATGTHSGPHSVLGAHPAGPGKTAIRTLRPEASAVSAVISGQRHPLEQLHAGGVFGAVLDVSPTDYRLEVSYGDQKIIVDDPYRWLPTLGELDLHLLGEGRHE
ncbi:MAG: 1,4-alpha-glucan branching enzyme, partial [Jatrophihabitantaceae bacterium]